MSYQQISVQEATTFERQSEENYAAIKAMIECSCEPYVDIFTLKRWNAQGMKVKKGSKSIQVKTYIPLYGDDGEQIGTRPWTAYLFCRCQVEASEYYQAKMFSDDTMQPVVKSNNNGHKPKYESVSVKPQPKPKGNPKLAQRFRDIADNMEKQIKDKLSPMSQNPTPRRMNQYRSRVHDGNILINMQKAYRVLADLHEAGTCPPELANIKTKAEIQDLVYTRWDGSCGYYDGHDTGIFGNNSEQAVMLQALITNPGEIDQRKQEIEREQMELHIFNLIKSVPGFFPTPNYYARKAVFKANIQPENTVCEPEAGGGAIAEVIREEYPDNTLEVYEYNYTLSEILSKKGFDVVGNDFLKCTKKYDRIIMNPPFENKRDIDHVLHAYDCLNDDGVLVAIMSAGTLFRSDNKTKDFREWLDEHGDAPEELPDDAFSESKTNVKTIMIRVYK